MEKSVQVIRDAKLAHQISEVQIKSDYPAMDSETVLPNSVERNDFDLIDIESLFDEDTDDRPVLSDDEAWELFS